MALDVKETSSDHQLLQQAGQCSEEHDSEFYNLTELEPALLGDLSGLALSPEVNSEMLLKPVR